MLYIDFAVDKMTPNLELGVSDWDNIRSSTRAADHPLALCKFSGIPKNVWSLPFNCVVTEVKCSSEILNVVEIVLYIDLCNLPMTACSKLFSMMSDMVSSGDKSVPAFTTSLINVCPRLSII